MNSEPIQRVFSEAIESAIPKGDLTVSGWADAYRYLAPERSNRSGRWRTDLVPYARAIMDAASNPDVHEIVIMKSSQVGGTEIINNILGYYMHIKPSPILYVCETQDKAKAWSQECLAPMIRDTPVLSALVEEARSRDSGNTIDGKRFPGGHLAIAWATSPATLSSRPRRVVAFDEIDGFGTTSEGDPISLGEARTKTFDDYLLIKNSSPRFEETSRIKPAYEASYKGKFYLPCPHCDAYQILVWANVHWDGVALKDAYYVCEHCAAVIEHDDKQEMLAKGEWRHEGEFNGSIGFFINELYSPFRTWGDMAIDWHKKKNQLDELQAFVNTQLGETWKPAGGEVEIGDLPSRCEDYSAEVPDGVLVLTAGVDVQHDRVEYEIVGWGLDDETWSIYYGRIYGDPSRKAIWEDLKLALTRDFVDADGHVRRVRAACVDTGGHHTQEVYDFCRRNRGRRFWAIKGANTPGKPLVPKTPTKQGKPAVDLWTIGTETAKDTFSAHLKLNDQGPGYCHFPAGLTDENGVLIYDEGHFKQLCAEKAVTKPMGRTFVRVWVKIKESLRNEALDCRVYAMAAKAILKPHLRALAAKRGRAHEEEVSDVPEAVEEHEEQQGIEPEPGVQTPAPRGPHRRNFHRPKGKGFVNSRNW
jgi:phage terminase large subunit GpA-like protein